jgi:hypothetical protein
MLSYEQPQRSVLGILSPSWTLSCGVSGLTMYHGVPTAMGYEDLKVDTRDCHGKIEVL